MLATGAGVGTGTAGGTAMELVVAYRTCVDGELEGRFCFVVDSPDETDVELTVGIVGRLN